MYCPKCGTAHDATAKFCSSCGTNFATAQGSQLGNLPIASLSGIRTPSRIFAKNKSPITALILSLLIVGLGQLYNGDLKKGGLMFLGAVIGGLLSAGIIWFLFAMWSAIDAYRVAKGAIPLWV